jgi:hypothetical protein
MQGDQRKGQRSAVILDFAGTCVKDRPIVQHAHGLFALDTGDSKGKGSVAFAEEKSNVRSRFRELIQARGII